LSENDISSILAPPSDQIRNELGWVLQVGVNHYDRIAIAVVETCGQRYLLAEIPT
jgi:hypothetical protein